MRRAIILAHSLKTCAIQKGFIRRRLNKIGSPYQSLAAEMVGGLRDLVNQFKRPKVAGQSGKLEEFGWRLWRGIASRVNPARQRTSKFALLTRRVPLGRSVFESVSPPNKRRALVRQLVLLFAQLANVVQSA